VSARPRWFNRAQTGDMVTVRTETWVTLSVRRSGQLRQPVCEALARFQLCWQTLVVPRPRARRGCRLRLVWRSRTMTRRGLGADRRSRLSGSATAAGGAAAPRSPREEHTPPTGLATILRRGLLAPSLLVNSRVCRRPRLKTLAALGEILSAVLPPTCPRRRCRATRSASCFWLPCPSTPRGGDGKFAPPARRGCTRTFGSRPDCDQDDLVDAAAMLASLQVEARTLTHGPDTDARFRGLPRAGAGRRAPVQAEAGLASGVARAAGSRARAPSASAGGRLGRGPERLRRGPGGIGGRSRRGRWSGRRGTR